MLFGTNMALRREHIFLTNQREISAKGFQYVLEGAHGLNLILKE